MVVWDINQIAVKGLLMNYQANWSTKLHRGLSTKNRLIRDFKGLADDYQGVGWWLSSEFWPTKLHRGLRTWWQVIKGFADIGPYAVWLVIWQFGWWFWRFWTILLDSLVNLVGWSFKLHRGFVRSFWSIWSFEGFVPKLPVCILRGRLTVWGVDFCHLRVLCQNCQYAFWGVDWQFEGSTFVIWGFCAKTASMHFGGPI